MTAQRIQCGDKGIGRADLLDRVARTAGGLARLGIARGDCVALLMRNSVEFVEISLAVGRLGAFAVPVNWHFAAPEIAALFDDCTPKVVFADADLAGVISPEWSHRVPIVRIDTAQREFAGDHVYAHWRDGAAPFTEAPRPSPGSIVYTSGTTGRAKGVKRMPATPTQQHAMRAVRETLYHAGAEDRVLVPGPLYHAFPNQLAMHAPLNAAHLEIMPRFDTEELLRLIERERITSLGVAPIMFIRLLQLPQEVRDRYDISSLKWVLHAGGPCPPDVKRAMIDWWGPVVAEYYGGTETGPLTLCTSAEWLERPGTCGRPIAGARILIVDADKREVACEVQGEIFARLDPYPDFTYHNDPAKREEVGLGDLVSLGDIGYRDADGYLYICDRVRDMIVSGGVNIYPAEIEGALLALPGVWDCAVFGIPDQEYGEALVGYVVGDGLDVVMLRQELRERIAGYKIPRTLRIVPSLARDPLGKLRKGELREQFLGAASK